MLFFELLKSLFLGIVEGITEWLPVSSTGHLIIAGDFIKLELSDAFINMYNYVIQLGAILAVIVLYFKRLNPFVVKEKKLSLDKNTVSLWFKVIVGVIPAAVFGLLLDDLLESFFDSNKLLEVIIVSSALVLYGVAFIVIERRNKNRSFVCEEVGALTYKQAIGIGMFQVLSIVPGTSRSGSTILGASLLGVNRTAAAEYSFFMAIPVMLGVSALKILKFGFDFSASELAVLAVGFVTAFLVSLAAIKFLMDYVRRHSFEVFGWYRIVLGIILIAYYLIKEFCFV